MAGKDERKRAAAKGAAAGAGPKGPWSRVPAGVWAAAGLAVLLVVFFNPIFFGGKVFQPPDEIASRAHKPYLEEAFSSGGSIIDRYPLWTPYIFSGMPSFGSLTAAPYTNPLSFALGFLRGEPKVVAYYLLLGVFLWLLLRRWGAAGGPAFFGATAYVFCTHLVTMIMFGHTSKIATLLFLPLVLWASHELWRRPSVRWTSVLALASGTMLVTSHLQIAYYTLLAAGLFLAVQTAASLRERMSVPGVLARWGSWVLGLGVGFAASSLVVFSVREYSRFSIRGGTDGGLPYDYATNWSLHPMEVSTFFLPSFFGFGQSTYWGWMPFTDFPLYMGILPLALALWTLAVWPKERLHVYLALLGLLSLVVAFGKHLPLLYNLLFEFLPFFNKFRVPSMITVLLQFATAVLAALGLTRALRGLAGEELRRARRALLVVGGGVALVVCALAGAMLSGSMGATVAARIVERTPPQSGVTEAQIAAYAGQVAGQVSEAAAPDFARVILVLALGLGLGWMLLGRRIPVWAGVAGIVVLTLIDLWAVGAKPADYRVPTENAAAFTETPTVRYLQGDPDRFRILPLTGPGMGNNWFAYFKVQSIQGYHPAKLKIYQDLIDERGPVGITRPLSRGNFNVLDMLNTKYLIVDPQTAGALAQLSADRFQVVQQGPETVVRNAGALPRLWFVPSARVVADEAQHLQALADPAWDPRREAILFEPSGPLDAPAGASATITRYEPREIDATVQSPGNCLLVMSEVFYEPGWHAYLDETRIPIHRANYVLRAFEIPPGTHELRLRFDPATFVLGAKVSAAAYLAALLGFAVSFARFGRRRGTVPGAVAPGRGA